ncbi:hypothetical protein RHA1_ro08104 (plasmid) [Rhodococcus jostii RHA1]|uniref:Uncharacterized protein n=1 Tax=Rhodococcus jostii (strain RHA1) TaxID=101510 RepID=Q0RZY5_RHOJR|nr:hypothetical protein RHA1_ro08104 [Rhodococcus jostii RHA1]
MELTSSGSRRLGSTSCTIGGNVHLRAPASRATVCERRCFFGCPICTPAEGCDPEVTSLLPAHAVPPSVSIRSPAKELVAAARKVADDNLGRNRDG